MNKKDRRHKEEKGKKQDERHESWHDSSRTLVRIHGWRSDENSGLQTRCIVKGEAQKSPLFWRFSGDFWFSQDRLFSRISTGKPLNLIKSPIFTNAPCKTACLYNAPSMHTLDTIFCLKRCLGKCFVAFPSQKSALIMCRRLVLRPLTWVVGRIFCSLSFLGPC